MMKDEILKPGRFPSKGTSRHRMAPQKRTVFFHFFHLSSFMTHPFRLDRFS